MERKTGKVVQMQAGIEHPQVKKGIKREGFVEIRLKERGRQAQLD